MVSLIRKVSWIAVLVAIVVLVVTSLPTLWGGHLTGIALLGHMMASGVVVVLLPVYAAARLMSAGNAATRFEWAAFRVLLVLGVITIATMFACMMPLASTATMNQLVWMHGWSGFAMAAAAVLMACVGWRRLGPQRVVD